MTDSKDSRAAHRLEAVRERWGLTGSEVARHLDVRQPTMSRILNGGLKPGRELAGRIEVLFLVPVRWWDEAPPTSDKPEPEDLPDVPKWLTKARDPEEAPPESGPAGEAEEAAS